MKTYRFPIPPEGDVPSRPASLRPFELMVGTYDDAVITSIEEGRATAVGGLSLVGSEGYIVPTVGIMQAGEETSEGMHIKGWSLHAGHPTRKFRRVRFFDTERSTKDLLLPLPDTIVYFGSEIDEKLVREDADSKELLRALQFVSAFISDEGPPSDIDWPQ